MKTKIGHFEGVKCKNFDSTPIEPGITEYISYRIKKNRTHWRRK